MLLFYYFITLKFFAVRSMSRHTRGGKGGILPLLRGEHRYRPAAVCTSVDEIVASKGIINAENVLANPAPSLHGEEQKLFYLLRRCLAVGVEDFHKPGKGLLETGLIAG
jgi:hypothetical protein